MLTIWYNFIVERRKSGPSVKMVFLFKCHYSPPPMLSKTSQSVWERERATRDCACTVCGYVTWMEIMWHVTSMGMNVEDEVEMELVGHLEKVHWKVKNKDKLSDLIITANTLSTISITGIIFISFYSSLFKSVYINLEFWKYNLNTWARTVFLNQWISK